MYVPLETINFFMVFIKGQAKNGLAASNFSSNLCIILVVTLTRFVGVTTVYD